MNSETVDKVATVSCHAVTRAQAKAGLQPLPDFHSSLLQGGPKSPRKSRHQRQLETYLWTPVPETSVEGLEVDGLRIPENIRDLQKRDKLLKSLFEKYVVLDDVVYLQFNDVTRFNCP